MLSRMLSIGYYFAFLLGIALKFLPGGKKNTTNVMSIIGTEAFREDTHGILHHQDIKLGTLRQAWML